MGFPTYHLGHIDGSAMARPCLAYACHLMLRQAFSASCGILVVSMDVPLATWNVSQQFALMDVRH